VGFVYGKLIWFLNQEPHNAQAARCFKRKVLLIFVWARILALAAGWIAAVCTGLLAGLLLGISPLSVSLAAGTLWTCLLLLQ
jgi:hypothetical protein